MAVVIVLEFEDQTVVLSEDVEEVIYLYPGCKHPLSEQHRQRLEELADNGSEIARDAIVTMEEEEANA